MLRIITHIERLLLVHDCVIVPKFGGFVLQTVSAVCNGEEHLFSPQRKEIVFNITLQHNDGLLSESYMQMYGVNYRKAQLMLEEDVDDMKAALQEEKRLSFGLLGSFSLGQEGQMIFHPGESDAFSVCSYGLAAFNFPQLKPVLAEREEVALLAGKKKKDTLYIPVSRKFLLRSSCFGCCCRFIPVGFNSGGRCEPGCLYCQFCSDGNGCQKCARNENGRSERISRNCGS